MDQEKSNKKKEISRAVALKYEPSRNSAPTVAAVGRGWLAERIITLAKENKVPIIEDKTMVKILGNLSLGEEVPAELYEAVAAIYAFILEADRRQSNL